MVFYGMLIKINTLTHIIIYIHIHTHVHHTLNHSLIHSLSHSPSIPPSLSYISFAHLAILCILVYQKNYTSTQHPIENTTNCSIP